MDQIRFGRLRRNVKALSAALGVGVLITMGAIPLAYPTSGVGTSWIAGRQTLLSR